MRLAIRDAADDELAVFYSGIYTDAFAAQHEPLAVWQAARRGELPYELRVRLAFDDAGIAGGVCCERYVRSSCALVTYVAVAERARGQGIGRRLIDDARGLFDVRAVFGEVNDPRTQRREPAEVAWARLRRFGRWGARVVDARYVQPALAPGLARDDTLVLIAFTDATTIDGAIVRDFVEALYAVTEGRPSQLAFAPAIALLDVDDGRIDPDR